MSTSAVLRATTSRRSQWSEIVAAATAFGGVLSRRGLHDMHVTRHQIRRHVEAGRCRKHGRQTIAVHTGPLSQTALWWRAMWEVGESIARLDGISALNAAGLTGVDESVVHVSVPINARVSPVSGVRVHHVRTPIIGEAIMTGLPRVRPPIAAIRAAHWSVSDRQAALVLAATAQQRLVRPEALRAAASLVQGRARRRLIAQLVADIADGAQSLGELDFGVWCRRRGLPAPERQVLRRSASGVSYLDVRWHAYGVVVEVDGSGHRVGLSVMRDNLRQNDVAISGDIVLRIDLVGLRVSPDLFMDQVEAALTSRGWKR